jgi:hypothetical protein
VPAARSVDRDSNGPKRPRSYQLDVPDPADTVGIRQFDHDPTVRIGQTQLPDPDADTVGIRQVRPLAVQQFTQRRDVNGNPNGALSQNDALAGLVALAHHYSQTADQHLDQRQLRRQLTALDCTTDQLVATATALRQQHTQADNLAAWVIGVARKIRDQKTDQEATA